MKAIGAEATLNGTYETAHECDWYMAKWCVLLGIQWGLHAPDGLRFKLHLRSKYGNGKTLPRTVPPLPPNKTVVDVFADFLGYLLACSVTYIDENHPNWSDSKDDIHFVLSHPNGWEGKEQSRMRKAAARAGLTPDTLLSHARISFVTEGEASLHFAVENGVLTQTMAVRNHLLVWRI